MSGQNSGPLERWLLPLFLALLLIGTAWLPGAKAPYQYDDYITPLGDPASQSLSAWSDAIPNTLRPLTKLSYAIESSLGATDAASRRLLNALVFGACAALLAELLRMAGLPHLLAWLFATLWAVQPVHAETIIALAGRPVLLALCFSLGSAVLLLKQRPWFALGCAFLAVLCRESALPWLLGCSIYSMKSLGLSRARLTAGVLGSFTLGVLVLLSAPPLRSLLNSAFGAASAWSRLGLQWAALSRGSWLLLADPAAFTLDMDFSPSAGARACFILLSLALYGGAFWLAVRRGNALALRVFALLWLCLVLPTQSIVPKFDALTARPYSASSSALVGLLACALAPWLARNARARSLVTLCAALLVVGLIPTTRKRAALYQDSIALWRDAALRSTHSTRPLVNLATQLAHAGRLEEASAVLELAVQRDPGSLDIRSRLAAARRLQGVKDAHILDQNFEPGALE